MEEAYAGDARETSGAIKGFDGEEPSRTCDFLVFFSIEISRDLRD